MMDPESPMTIKSGNELDMNKKMSNITVQPLMQFLSYPALLHQLELSPERNAEHLASVSKFM